jgi:hypothetical protein
MSAPPVAAPAPIAPDAVSPSPDAPVGTAAGAPTSSHFRVVVVDGSTAIEVDERDGNAFSLGPVLRKYTTAKLSVRGLKRTTSVDLRALTDALGLLRALRHDVAQFNAAASAPSPGEARYLAFRLTRQAAAFGVRVPRPGEGVVSSTRSVGVSRNRVGAPHSALHSAGR